VAKTEKGSDWAAMGKGIIDWAGQFAALKHDGYRQAVSLETHWHGAGTSEASSVECWLGMKEALERAKAL
jgi:L-ribulose-5-phosphate 3-epimerase